MSDAIKYLYSKFILRDVLSFITPGAIVTITALLLFRPAHVILYLSHSIHWALYIPIFGVFYIIGFALQCFGELVGIIRFTPYSEKNRHKRWSMFCCNLKKNMKNMWWWREEKKLSDFYEEAKTNEGIQQGHERMVILKQMCGNGFMAIFIAVVFILVYFFCPCIYVRIALGGLLTIILLGSLFWGHRVHMLKQFTRETIFMERRGR